MCVEHVSIKYATIYIACMRVCMYSVCVYECMHMYVIMCAHVGMYPYCLGFQELRGFQVVPSFLVCLHDPECQGILRLWGARGSLLILRVEVGEWNICEGIFHSIPCFLYHLCACAHTYTHAIHTHTHTFTYTHCNTVQTHKHTHTFTNTPHTFPLCHVGFSCLIYHHDHTHQLGRVRAHGHLNPVGSPHSQSEEVHEVLLYRLISCCASPLILAPGQIELSSKGVPSVKNTTKLQTMHSQPCAPSVKLCSSVHHK